MFLFSLLGRSLFLSGIYLFCEGKGKTNDQERLDNVFKAVNHQVNYYESQGISHLSKDGTRHHVKKAFKLRSGMLKCSNRQYGNNYQKLLQEYQSSIKIPSLFFLPTRPLFWGEKTNMKIWK